ncbi:hypothetical protein N658DRAFT_496358 [Parathielavia hyrcaniae]|uniref:Uncharacterized protein n=1 Tax=Parathielavia hyrcaniae TaxID=113614 RepID=A0AAN6T1N1_9PEZI|nr:hypothetical protein N658DRAFT_496358 [Parathielavia hyrcaniae]
MNFPSLLAFGPLPLPPATVVADGSGRQPGWSGWAVGARRDGRVWETHVVDGMWTFGLVDLEGFLSTGLMSCEVFLHWMHSSLTCSGLLWLVGS